MAKKKTTRKVAAKKAPRKKTATKKTTKKAAAKKPTTKKAPTRKKTTKKTVAKKTTKKKTTKSAPVKKKTAVKKTTKKKTTKKAAAPASPPKPKAPTKPEDMTLDQAMEKEWSIPQLKRVKTGLKKKDLNEFLQMLLDKRAEIIGNVQGMEDARNAALGDIAHMPLHMSDVGSDNFEQEFALGLMEAERSLLREIEEAIVRMRDGYYGVCLDSARPINRARLEAKPWAKYCIEVARLHEKRGW